MGNRDRALVSKQRKLLENPYAHIERLVASQPEAVTSATAIAARRKLLENPYAYLTGDGGYSTLEAPQGPQLGASNWTDERIEAKVRELHARLWREREQLWAGSVPADPIGLLDPGVALRTIGFGFELVDGLGPMRGQGRQVEVAGLIDNRAKVVRVGRQFPMSVRAFTAAHELGHAVLHPSLSALHRDKPLDGSPMTVDRVEVEANKFATLFLMPAKLVRGRFAERFLTERFELTDETAFALAGCSISKLQESHGSRRRLAQLLAGARRYNGCHFVPLHEQFRVSREAMAIRLEELGLVPPQS